jgi:hypothetical protein
MVIQNYLELMEGVSIVGHNVFNNREMATRTSQGEGSVVIIGGLFVHICIPRDKELHSAQVASSTRFHQRSSTTFRLMLL